MTVVEWLGIFCIGFVFGYLLFYSVRHTKEFNPDLLTTAVGAVGGGTVIKLAGGTAGWLGPYGIGIGVGFVVYGVMCLVLIRPGAALAATDPRRLKLTAVSQALLGKPRAE